MLLREFGSGQIGLSYLHDLECLYLSRVLNMGAPTEINKCTTAVDSTAFASHELVDVVQFVFAVTEHLLEVLFGDFQSVEALLLLKDLRGLGLKLLPVLLMDNSSIFTRISIGECGRRYQETNLLSGQFHVVEETLVSRRTMRQFCAREFTFTCLS